MKYFFLLMTMSMWSGLILANPDFVGTWVFSDSQCRNSNVDSDSAESITWDSGGSGFDPTSMKLVVESNGSANFTSCCNEEGNPTRETGSWNAVEDEAGEADPTQLKVGNDDGGFTGWLINGEYVADSDNKGDLIDNSICGSNDKTFVIVFGRVDQ